jgi:hypothetical protein
MIDQTSDKFNVRLNIELNSKHLMLNNCISNIDWDTINRT